MSNIQPILLTHHNELTIICASHTQKGGYPFVVLHDPDHIADVIKARKKRDLVLANNERHWS